LLPALYLLVQNHRFYPSLTKFRLDFDYYLWDADWLAPLVMFCQSAEIHGIHCTVIITGLYEIDLYEPYDEDIQWRERGWGWNEDVEWAPCRGSFGFPGNQRLPDEWFVCAEEEDLAGRMRSVVDLAVTARSEALAREAEH
jgi:hypothetical protein